MGSQELRNGADQGIALVILAMESGDMRKYCSTYSAKGFRGHVLDCFPYSRQGVRGH